MNAINPIILRTNLPAINIVFCDKGNS